MDINTHRYADKLSAYLCVSVCVYVYRQTESQTVTYYARL